MQITEGVKISQQLLNQALSDPNSTLGFEVEFFVMGARDFVRHEQSKGARSEGNMLIKKIGDLNWHDILRHFDPVSISPDEDEFDNEMVMLRRLYHAYKVVEKKDPNEVNPDKMWDSLTSKFGVHGVLPMLKIWPDFGGTKLLLDDEHADMFLEMVEDGDIREMIQYKKFNEVELAVTNIPDDDFDFGEESASRNEFYGMVADYFSEALGERVVYSANEGRALAASNNYKHWHVTDDSSLHAREQKYDVIGVELVSPVMQAAEGYQALNKILDIMNEGVLGLPVETTYETGLHINYGVRGKEIDAIKILILIGDEHMTKKFDRVANAYAASISKELEKRTAAAARGQTASALTPRDLVLATSKALTQLRQDPKDVERTIQVLDSLKLEGKRHSINFGKLPSGYVEYRTIGNKDYHKRRDDIMQTVNRMIGITYIATDKEAYRNEFLKKLYLLMRRIFAHTLPSEGQPIGDSVGSISGNFRGGYGNPLDQYREKTQYDGENYDITGEPA